MIDEVKKTVTILTPCFNEVENVEELTEAFVKIGRKIPDVRINHLFIDNASTDGTVEKLRTLCSKHSHVQAILNNRNYGHIRSPMHGLFQTQGDAVVVMASDFQDPPELIIEFVNKWKQGYKTVIGIKEGSDESITFSIIRRFYYSLINRLSETPLIKNFNGFGLYDREVIETLRSLDDPYPYFRGLISELGFEIARVNYKQPKRKRGFSKNNLYTLYDMAMLGITNHSKIPLRLVTFSGFVISFLSMMVGLGYFIYKVLFWDRFDLGIAPLVIGIFFFAAVQLFFIGIIGEYVGSIYTQVLKRPLVIEKERINF
jgi:glycosyltransferase involved in cell wall biosynthesis